MMFVVLFLLIFVFGSMFGSNDDKLCFVIVDQDDMIFLQYYIWQLKVYDGMYIFENMFESKVLEKLK